MCVCVCVCVCLSVCLYVCVCNICSPVSTYTNTHMQIFNLPLIMFSLKPEEFAYFCNFIWKF